MPTLDHSPPPRNSKESNLANPNPRRVSFHLDPVSIHSLQARSSSFESPRVVPDHPTIPHPSSGPPTRHTSRNPLTEHPKRSVSYSASGLRPNSLPPPEKTPDKASFKPRPLSMSASELAARHRAALHRFQQPSNKPITSSLSYPSPLSQSFSFDQTAEKKSYPKPRPKQNPIQSYHNPINQDRTRGSSAYVQSLALAESGKLLINKKNLNQAEKNLLNIIPPLPPHKPIINHTNFSSNRTNNNHHNHVCSQTNPQKHDNESTANKSSCHHDPYSWFDY